MTELWILKDLEDFFEEWDEDDFEDDNSSLLKPPDRFHQRPNIIKTLRKQINLLYVR